jgi:hypothetical protein
VFGFDIDIPEFLKNIDLNEVLPRRIVVLSEEPLWDTVFSINKNLKSISAKLKIKSGNGIKDIAYTVLNHSNSDLFSYDRFPYFIQTTPEYIFRYAPLFRSLLKLNPKDLLSSFHKREYRSVFLFEKRTEDYYDIVYGDLRIGLSKFRTEVAALADGTKCVSGFGWGNQRRRQSSINWHLEKLVRFNRKGMLFCAIENTNSKFYTTEKIFDAFAVGSVPIAYIAPDSRILKVIPERSFINVHGDTPGDVIERLNDFNCTNEFCESYIESVDRLYKLCCDFRAYKEQVAFTVKKMSDTLIGLA